MKSKILLLTLAVLGAFILSAAPAQAQRFHGRGGYGHYYGHYYGHRYYPRSSFYFGVGYPFYGYGYGYPYGYGYYPYGSYGSGYGYYSNARVYDGRPVANGNVAVQVQRQLAREGFYHGAIDGVVGDGTRRAIRSYERANGLRVTGQIDNRLLATLNRG